MAERHMAEGVCRYCGQVHMVEIHGKETKEQIDLWAEEKCDCADAKGARRKKKANEKAVENIEGIAGTEQETGIREILIKGLEYLEEQKIERVQVKMANRVYTVEEGKEGRIKVSLKITQKKELLN